MPWYLEHLVKVIPVCTVPCFISQSLSEDHIISWQWVCVCVVAVLLPFPLWLNGQSHVWELCLVKQYFNFQMAILFFHCGAVVCSAPLHRSWAALFSLSVAKSELLPGVQAFDRHQGWGQKCGVFLKVYVLAALFRSPCMFVAPLK